MWIRLYKPTTLQLIKDFLNSTFILAHSGGKKRRRQARGKSTNHFSISKSIHPFSHSFWTFWEEKLLKIEKMPISTQPTAGKPSGCTKKIHFEPHFYMSFIMMIIVLSGNSGRMSDPIRMCFRWLIHLCCTNKVMSRFFTRNHLRI